MRICEAIYTSIRSHLVEITAGREKRTLKKDGSYVTEGDLFCQEIILDVALSRAPELIPIAEEINNDSFRYDSSKSYIVIDPVDGTENFTSGLLEWGTGISIYQHGEHVESMIALPELDRVIYSGERITRKAGSRIQGLSSGLSKENLLALQRGYEYRMTGCCMYNMFCVLTGSFENYENPKGAHSWDVLPGFNIAIENGLDVMVEGERYHGEFLLPNAKYRFRISN